MTIEIKDLKFTNDGLIPAIVQDYNSRQILMVAYMNEESLKKTLESKQAWFFSRSRQKLWLKGESSGNILHVIQIDYDCDEDTLLLQVLPDGPACHTGAVSCFYRTMYSNPEKTTGNSDILRDLYNIISDRAENPVEGSYTNYLLTEGVDKICKKIGEEATETVIGAKNDNPAELTAEASDLLYHLTVLLVNQGVTLEDIFKELTNRFKK
jgi:phosphoribosyl-ATP pyrophosphohydrolase/phosphoribosyl-AMP cyclohydrolase